MKIDRLLSIIVFLLDRNLVSAREMAERFGVTPRTIQRDMDTIGLAGIPVYAVQGPQGGYGILDTFKMDRRLVSPEDLYFIITSLRGVSESLGGRDGEAAPANDRLDLTLEKMKGLLPPANDGDLFSDRSDRLHIDFTMLGGDPRHRGTFRAVRQAVDAGRVVRFSYTDNNVKVTHRTVEPLTVAFRWRSWYLYGWCRLREDYRLFRISRIREIEVTDEGFRRRGLRFEDFIARQPEYTPDGGIEVVLKFRPEMRPLAEEFHETVEITDDGGLIARMRMPEDGWLYGYILSWGTFVEVLEPLRLRQVIAEAASGIRNLYQPGEKKSD